MAEFAESMNSYSYSPFLHFMEFDQSLEPSSQVGELSDIVMQNPNLGFVGYANEGSSTPKPGFAMPFTDNMSGGFSIDSSKPTKETQPNCSMGYQIPGDKKRKAMEGKETSSWNSSASQRERMTPRNGKRGRKNSKEVVEPKEVVHVRARRGQATDSHSLAERMRREKINARMRCLQDIVPGCYKTMGMAGVLDEIINYVHSLQNQVEFLSMKISDASSFNGFSMARPQVNNVKETQEVERLVRESYGGMN